MAAVFLDFDASGYDITGNQIRGHYTPFGWRLFYQGTANACSRDGVDECSAVQKQADCYLRQLNRCNVITPTR